MISLEINNNYNLLLTPDTKGIIIDDLTLVEDEVSNNINIDHKTFNMYSNWFYYDNCYWYLKYIYTIRKMMNELVGESLTKYMGLSSIEYTLALSNLKKIRGLLSKNFRENDCEYKYNKNSNSKDVLNSVERDYIRRCLFTPNGNDELENDLAIYVVRNYYAEQADRDCNVLFEVRDNHLSLGTLFDYEASFYNSTEDYIYDPLFNVIDDKVVEKLKSSNPHFKEAFDKIMEFDMNRALDEICEKHKIVLPEEVSKHYKAYDEKRKIFMNKK